MTKTCLIFRYAPIYRMPIYKLLEEEMNVSFIFPSEALINLKKADYSKLRNCTFCGNEKRIFNKLSFFSDINKKELFSFDNLIFAGNVKNLTSWYILIVCRFFKKNIKTFLWTHGYYGKENFFEKLIKKKFYNLPDYVLLYGNYAKNLMIANRICNPSKLKLVYNSLDYDTHVALRKTNLFSEYYRCHFKNANKNIIFIGRLTKIKKLDMLIFALKLLNERAFKVNVTFIGDGEAKKGLIELTNKYHLNDQVWFFGESYDEEILSKLIYNSDLCVSPGNVGLTAIHSLSFGTPVITHNNYPYQGPEFEAIEPYITGLFFKYNSIDSLVQSILEWFSKNIDREIVRKNCYKVIAEKYNPYYQLQILKSLLN
ncbi:MAG: glycosyltransferase [Bacteroidales bacterium]